MTIPASSDVVVIGSGPAGSITAALLAQKGYDTVILEKERHPRYKVGESLIPDFWKYTDLAGVTDKILEEGFIAKAGGMVRWKGEARAHTFSDFGYNRPAMHVERDKFDKILFDHAVSEGAQAFQEVTVTGADFHQEGDRESATVHYTNGDGPGTIDCRYVLDASGQAAVIGRQEGIREMDDGFRYLGVWGYYEDSKYVSVEGKIHPFEDWPTVPPTTFVTSLEEAGDSGWAWHIVLREMTSVGIVIPIELVKSVRNEGESWEDFFRRRVLEVPVLGELLRDATCIEGSVQSIRDYSYRSSQLAGPGYFLIGDAAGFVDPIFSVGVVLGMYSAGAAAWAVDYALSSNKSAERARALYSRQLQGRLEVARSLALPRYRSEGEVSDLAKTAIQLERPAVRELMYVVSSLTTRSDNWLEMVGGEAPELEEGQLRTIEQIDV